MLSCLETSQGLTVIGPTGESLRLARSNPAFLAGKALIAASMPGEQLWVKLQSLMADPLGPVIEWASRFGVSLLKVGEDELELNGYRLAKANWLPLLNRSLATAGSPIPALKLANLLGGAARTAKVDNFCLYWEPDIKGDNHQVGILIKAQVPDKTLIGDRVIGLSSGFCEALVAYDSLDVAPDGNLIFNQGKVVDISRSSYPELSAEPVIMGNNRTYKCEEGSPEGWFEDLSFDSLTEAKANVVSIQKSGAEARIINRISNMPVPL